MNPREKSVKVGDQVRTAIALPGIPVGTLGVVKEIGRPFVVVAFADGRHGYYARRQLRAARPDDQVRAICDADVIPLGIDDLQVPRSSHTCLLPSSQSVAASVASRYVAAGLGNGETLVCFIPPKGRAALLRNLSQLGIEADLAVKQRQLRIVAPSSVYFPAADFDALKQLDAVAAFASEATREAPGGLRCCGFVGDMYKAKGWWQYESGVTQVLRDYRFAALCVYDSSARRAGITDKLYETHTHVLRDAKATRGRVAS